MAREKAQRVHGDDWRAWLAKLEHDIRGVHLQQTRTGNLVECGNDTPMGEHSRRLSFEEWGRIQALIREHDLIAVPRNACMGFGCAITLYEELEPIYPGVPPQPRKLIDITQDHLPGASREHGPRFNEAWAQFSPFTHTDRNKQRAKREGLGTIREKSHYDY